MAKEAMVEEIEQQGRRADVRPPKRAASHRHAVERAIPWHGLHLEAQERFGIEHFRPGQRQVLEAIFQGRNVLALMPTGSGKSLCYQLPALFLPKPVVVVSPLIALMQDQQAKAEQAEIAVEKIDSTLSTAEQQEVAELIEQGIPQLLYVTPERLENREFLDHLRESGVSLMAVDEAHCISQWGHDFRPAYMGLKYARERLGNPPVVALTATATEEVVKDILCQLGVEDAVMVNTGTERPNLTFSVHHTVNTAAKQKRLVAMIAEEQGTGIIYTASVRAAIDLHEWLGNNGISVARYHGRMRTRERVAIQESFMRGEYKVLIATKAFGMGIDKPDIRFVYHYEFPDSLESYYQEAGRAGRDGEAARAVLLYRLEDRRIQRFFLLGRYPRMEELRAVIEALEPVVLDPVAVEGAVGEAAKSRPRTALAIAERSGVPRRRTQAILYLLRQAGLIRRTVRGYTRKAQGVSDAALAELLASFTARSASDKKRLEEMMHYAESAQCRKQLLRGYFGEAAGEPCGACDNCLEPERQATAWEIPERSRHEKVVEVITAVGEIVTTAPETLPKPDSRPKYSKGDAVRHRKFGEGKVLDVDGENLMVRFKGGAKTVRTTYVQSA